jgi:sugar-specific transcriptional regulator TrmB
MNDLTAAGLTPTESKCYITLLEKDEWKPSELAIYVNETRTNCYKVLDNLVLFGLADRFDKNKKLHYRATNPTKLLELARLKKSELEESEKVLENRTQELLKTYFKTQEQPGIRYFQGKIELKEIYDDQIKTKEPIYIVRPDYNMDIYDFEFMTEIRHRARRANIIRYAITPDREKAPKNYRVSDPFMLLNRTWMPKELYTASVEWNAYGNKLAILSYGNEATGIIIESPQITAAFIQLYKILEIGLRRDPDYANLPKYAKNVASTY